MTPFTVLVVEPRAARRFAGRQEAGIQPKRPPWRGWRSQPGRGRFSEGTSISSISRMLAAFALVATATALFPSTALAADTSTPPFPPGTVGVVGCSNTAQHVEGYLEASVADQMPRYAMGGLSLDVWGDPAATSYAAAWGRYDSERPLDGYQAAWVMLCIKAEDLHDPNLLLTEVVGQIRQRDPDIPVYVSPINEYAEGLVCGRIGPDGFTKGVNAVGWGVLNLAVVTGPTTGPLTTDLLATDGCHLNSAGIDLVGDQLVAWFDDGGWAETDTSPPSPPAGLAAPSVSTVSVGLAWSAATDDVGVDHYVVVRDGVDLATTTATSYTDATVAASTGYGYVVHAVDAAGNRSAASNQVSVTTPAPSADTTPPTVSITAPASGATVSGTTAVSVTASDNVRVASVEVRVDGVTVGTDTTAPHTVAWNTTTAIDGSHTLTAVATDTSGNTTTSAGVTVTVGNTAPSGQFTASPNPATVGQVVTFTDTHPGTHRRTITYGDGATASSKTKTFTHAYTAAGTYTATLQTVDVTTGLRVTLTLTVTITT